MQPRRQSVRKFGTYPQMTVKDARAKARAFLEKPDKFVAQSGPVTLKDVDERWFDRHVIASGLISQGEISGSLKPMSISDGLRSAFWQFSAPRLTSYSITSPIRMGPRKPMQYWLPLEIPRILELRRRMLCARKNHVARHD